MVNIAHPPNLLNEFVPIFLKFFADAVSADRNQSHRRLLWSHTIRRELCIDWQPQYCFCRHRHLHKTTMFFVIVLPSGRQEKENWSTRSTAKRLRLKTQT